MKKRFLFISLGAVFAFAGLAVSADAGTSQLDGVANFHQVDPNLYRGAQPTAEGLKSLATLGVKTIVDLRHGKDHSDGEQREAEALGLKYVNVPMQGLTAPTEQETSRLLAIIAGANQGPVFVHCREGKDRTGAVIASYRISHDHWSNNKALDEAKAYGMHSGQQPRQNYILNFTDSPAN